MTQSQPLDRSEFETVKQLLASAASYAESANEGFNKALIKIDDNANAISRLEAAVLATNRQLQAFLAQSTADKAQREVDISNELAARDEFRKQMIGLQTESQNILLKLAEILDRLEEKM